METNNAVEGKTWREKFIKKNNEKIMIQVIALPIVPFLFVLVQAVIWPGYIYCSDYFCSGSYTPAVPDVATLPIGKEILISANFLQYYLFISIALYWD